MHLTGRIRLHEGEEERLYQASSPVWEFILIQHHEGFFILMQLKIDLQDETFLYERIKQPLEKYFCGLGVM